MTHTETAIIPQPVAVFDTLFRSAKIVPFGDRRHRQPTGSRNHAFCERPLCAPKAVIRALAKFYYRSHGVFAKTRADYQSSHETHLVIEEQFMPGAASLPNPAQRCRLRRAAPSTWIDHETPSPRPAHRLIPVAIHSRPSWSLRPARVRKGEPPACAMDTKQ
jgi:hypothetical protein